MRLLVASRVSKVPGSVGRPCARCGATVYVSPATLKAIAHLEPVEVACVECVPASEVRGVPMVPLTREQRLEMLAHQNRN